MDLKTNLDEHDFLLKKEPVFMLRNQINLKIFMAPIPIYGSLQQFSFFFTSFLVWSRHHNSFFRLQATQFHLPASAKIRHLPFMNQLWPNLKMKTTTNLFLVWKGNVAEISWIIVREQSTNQAIIPCVNTA